MRIRAGDPHAHPFAILDRLKAEFDPAVFAGMQHTRMLTIPTVFPPRKMPRTGVSFVN